MTQTEFINEVAEKNGMTKAQAKRVLVGISEMISGELKKGSDIELPWVGKFLTGVRKAKEGRNPQTGEKITIPEKKVVKFKAAKKLRDMLA